jgi:hypothetical protein
MDPTAKIPADRLVIGLTSAFRTLVFMLAKNGAIGLDEYVISLQRVATEHRQTGDPDNLASAIDAISIHIQSFPLL